MTTALAPPTPGQKAYRPYGAAEEMFYCKAGEVLLSGPAGCLAGETLLNSAVRTPQRIDWYYHHGMSPVVETLWGPLVSTVPFLKGRARLYRVTMRSGRSCVMMGQHIILTPGGWKRLSEIVVGEECLVSAPCRTTLLPGDRRWMHTASDLKDGYSPDRRLRDEQPLRRGDTDLASLPLRADVPERNRAGHSGDVRAAAPGYTPAYPPFVHPSTRDCWRQPDESADTQHDSLSAISPPSGVCSQCGGPFPPETVPPSPIGAGNQHCGDTPIVDGRNSGGYPAGLASAGPAYRSPRQSERHPSHSGSPDTMRESLAAALALDAYNLSRLHSSKSYYTAQWDVITSIKFERTDAYFDLHVPGAEHYLAGGIWHHNTGKSRAILEKLHLCAEKYAGMRGLILRKTRASLTQSGLHTFENNVVPDDHPILGRVQRESRRSYRYPNGSELVVGGLDNPNRVMSTDYDVIFIQEATECDEDDWEKGITRLRNHVMPYQQLLADCNPDAPHHWLYQRAQSGQTLLLESRHEHNPSVTPEYLAALDSLTGVRYKRLRLGLWVAAEGMVYEGWDPAIHRVDQEKLRQWGIIE